MSAPIPRVPFLHYSLHAGTLQEMIDVIGRAILTPQTVPALVVTLNPEITMQAEQSPQLKTAIAAAQFVVADGIGIVWGVKQLGQEVPERVPGVDLATGLLAQGSPEVRVFLLGGKPGVSERAAHAVEEQFPARVAGHHHGYFDRADTASIAEMVRRSGANLLLAGLGEGQELLLHEHRDAWGVNVMIGVGGTLDVLAGEAKRMPTITQKLRLEWLFRIAFDRSRWHRFPRLLAYARFIRQHRRLP